MCIFHCLLLLFKFGDFLHHYREIPRPTRAASITAARPGKSCSEEFYLLALHPGHPLNLWVWDGDKDGWMDGETDCPKTVSGKREEDQEMCHLHRYKGRVQWICLSHRVSCVHSSWVDTVVGWPPMTTGMSPVSYFVSPPGREMPAIPQVRRRLYACARLLVCTDAHKFCPSATRTEWNPLGNEEQGWKLSLGQCPGLPWRRRWGLAAVGWTQGQMCAPEAVGGGFQSPGWRHRVERPRSPQGHGCVGTCVAKRHLGYSLLAPRVAPHPICTQTPSSMPTGGRVGWLAWQRAARCCPASWGSGLSLQHGPHGHVEMCFLTQNISQNFWTA